MTRDQARKTLDEICRCIGNAQNDLDGVQDGNVDCAQTHLKEAVGMLIVIAMWLDRTLDTYKAALAIIATGSKTGDPVMLAREVLGR